MKAAATAARTIRLVIFDVDGVLTDGRLHYRDDGGEYKSFHVRDGLGIKLLQRAGIQAGIITGRRSPSVERRAAELGIEHLLQRLERRAAELGIEHLLQGREDKLEALRELLAASFPQWVDDLSAVAYMGDDLPDLPAMLAVGLGMTVADAAPAVAARADWRASLPGGAGAAREAAEFILRAQGRDDLLEPGP